jgi:hypothetical protein
MDISRGACPRFSPGGHSFAAVEFGQQSKEEKGAAVRIKKRFRSLLKLWKWSGQGRGRAEERSEVDAILPRDCSSFRTAAVKPPHHFISAQHLAKWTDGTMDLSNIDLLAQLAMGTPALPLLNSCLDHLHPSGQCRHPEPQDPSASSRQLPDNGAEVKYTKNLYQTLEMDLGWKRQLCGGVRTFEWRRGTFRDHIRLPAC